MMWKDEGYMASGEKLVSPSLNAFNNASKALDHAFRAFSDASKSVQSCIQIMHRECSITVQ